jgi:hypothetical protein
MKVQTDPKIIFKTNMHALTPNETGIKLVHNYFLVVGNLGNEAIVVTKSDEVFAIGSNAAGCLGLGDLQSTLFPKKVEALCNKNVKGIKNISLVFVVYAVLTTVGDPPR